MISNYSAAKQNPLLFCYHRVCCAPATTHLTAICRGHLIHPLHPAIFKKCVYSDKMHEMPFVL